VKADLSRTRDLVNLKEKANELKADQVQADLSRTRDFVKLKEKANELKADQVQAELSRTREKQHNSHAQLVWDFGLYCGRYASIFILH